MRPSKGWISLSLTLGLLAGLPAEASEVVKLARLVVGGKRAASTEATRTAPAEQRSTNTNSQAQGGTSGLGGGGGEDTGNAPAPARGVS